MPFNSQISCKVKGKTLKLTYLPAKLVSSSSDSKSLLEPVIKI